MFLLISYKLFFHMLQIIFTCDFKLNLIMPSNLLREKKIL